MFSIFWDFEEVKAIIKQDHTVFSSFLNLLYSTLFSLMVLCISFFVYGFKAEALISLYINCYVWLYSAGFAWYFKYLIKPKKASQKDATADFLVVVNELQKNYLIITSIILSLISFVPSFGLYLIMIYVLVIFVLYLLSWRIQYLTARFLYDIPAMQAIAGVFGAAIVCQIIVSIIAVFSWLF